MKRVIVISVGTSLLTNNERNSEFLVVSDLLDAFRSGMVKTKTIDVRKTSEGWNAQPENADHLKDVAEIFDKYYFNEDNIKTNINLRATGKDLLPAEISSLFLFYYDRDGKLREDKFRSDLKEGSETEFREKDRIILLTTDTADAVYCANIIREMIKHVPLFSEKCTPDEKIEIIPNLDVYQPDKWTKTTWHEEGANLSGINSLYNYFSNLKRSNPETSRIIIRTGGYKELCANLLMIGMDRGFKTYYLFEKSYEFVVVDTLRWPSSYREVATNMKRRI